MTMNRKEKILLVLLPFWSPLIPPLGISCLKSFLQKHGCRVTAVDVNGEEQLRELYDKYFDTLRNYVPEDNVGNFYSIGQDILRNHMMAYFNYTDENEYNQLIKLLVCNTYYFDIDDRQAGELDRIVKEFYTRLESYFIRLLEKEQPDILGLSVFNGTLPASMFAARLTREKCPQVRIFMGGGVFADQLAENTPNFEFFLEKTDHYLDKIVIGEGELLFLKLLRDELPDSQKVFTLKDIDWEIMDISSAEIPDFSDFNLRTYPNLASYTSRSCPFQCSFCSETVQWGKYRKKSARQIVAELKELYRRHHYQLFYMSDSLLNPVITDLAREFTGEELSIYWDGCIRVDKQACDTEKTLLWRRGGFYRARLGLESGSQHVLDLMNKKITREEIKKALTSLAYAGIKTSTLWVIGHPSETEEDFQQTLDLIEELKDYIYDVEGTPFWYHLQGQSNSSQWLNRYKPVLLYPEKAKHMLITQTWIIPCEPSREETYQRQNRFIKHLNRLGIPNPYSMEEIFKADERWKKLHKNAVPSLVAFEDNYIDENKTVKKLSFGRSTMAEEADFCF
jgi:radical SAM superfamily enzyme YgiQ (UPF0313 family)